jgi:hypothetical protein
MLHDGEHLGNRKTEHLENIAEQAHYFSRCQEIRRERNGGRGTGATPQASGLKLDDAHPTAAAGWHSFFSNHHLCGSVTCVPCDQNLSFALPDGVS